MSLIGLDYGNGNQVEYTYDKQGRITSQSYEDGDTVTYTYDNSGALATVTDSATGITTTYYYDFTDRLLRYAEKGTDYNHIVGYEYDSINNLTALIETINGTEYKTTYGYDDDNRVTSVTNSVNNQTGASETYAYDVYGRVSGKVTKNGDIPVLTDTFTYRTIEPDEETGQPKRETAQIETLQTTADGYDVTYEYEYDSNGNIVTVKVGNKTTKYTYDSANQLIREDNPYANKTYVWTYDNAGNITQRKEYGYTTAANPVNATVTVPYTYGNANWGDLLKYYDGHEIQYDAIGNPTNYYNGTSWTFGWEHGRELMTMSNGTTTWTNTYNADGLRTRRSSSTKTYTYVYNGSSLSQMTVGGNTMYFTYDASGSPLSVKYGDETYYYATNLQGDVTAILDADGDDVVRYTYDAWGKILSTTGELASTLGTANPLRYRGYVYDTETGFYYLQSRYYDPKIGRFINADALVSTGQGILGNNMFAYCGNNPVSFTDPTGCFWETFVDAFNEVVNQSKAIFVFAGGISQLDSPVLGPADVVAVGIAALTTIACFSQAIYLTAKTQRPPSFSSEHQSSIPDDLGTIAGSFGNFQCKKLLIGWQST